MLRGQDRGHVGKREDSLLRTIPGRWDVTDPFFPLFPLDPDRSRGPRNGQHFANQPAIVAKVDNGRNIARGQRDERPDTGVFLNQ